MIKKLVNSIAAILMTFGVWSQADLAINPTITSPVSGCYLSNTTTITATLVNTSAFGYAGTVEMGYILDNGTPVTETQTIGFLPGSGTFIYSFPNPTAGFAPCGVHDLQLWVYDSSDPNNLNDTINVQITSDCDPVVGYITGPDTVCVSNNNGEFTLNGHTGNVQEWGSSIDNGVTWGYISTTDTFLVFNNLPSETQVEVVVGSPYGYCPADTTPIYTLYMDQPSFAGTAIPDFDICDNGNSGQVWTTGYTGNILDWNLSTNFGGGWIPLSSAGQDTIDYSNLTDTTWWQVIVKNGTCPADTTGPVVATLIQGTQAGTVDGVPVVCNLENDEDLIASGGYGDVIAWYVSTDSGTTWQPTTTTNDSIYSFTGLSTNTWFAAEWQFGSCPTEWATHGVTVLPVITQQTPDTTIEEGDAINLNVCCGQTYNWFPDQYMDDPNSQTPIVNPDVDITYFCEVISIEGCKDTVKIAVTVNPDLTTLQIPDLITPNADGYNDQWQIGNIDSFTENELTIFNIYGQVVYSAQPYNNEWEGTYNGNKLPDGTYFYILNLNDIYYPDPIQGVVTIAGND